MFLRLLSLFILVPLADLFLLLVINKYLTLLPTMTLVVVTGIVGVWLARQQWANLVANSRSKIIQNQIPTEIFSDGTLILLAGALLITPGILTDIVGITLLIPSCRRWYRARFLKWLKGSFRVETYRTGTFQGGTFQDDDVVEGRAHPKAQANGESAATQATYIDHGPQ
jgi:UPF0716 protein FxsA